MVRRFIGRLSEETKPRPQKLANIIDRLTPALQYLTVNFRSFHESHVNSKQIELS